jgi:hypothetical protein
MILCSHLECVMSMIDTKKRISTPALLICVAAIYSQAGAQAPRPEPPLEVTSEMRERFESVCNSSVHSIDARHRSATQYAYIHCTPLADALGRGIAPVVYCERNIPEASWSCRDYKTNVRATVAGKPIAFSFEHTSLEKSLEVLRFLFAAPQLGTVVPKQWAPASVGLSQGRFLVSGNVESDRYSFEVREAASSNTRFEVLQVSRCRTDTCHPIWSAGER